MTVSSEVNRWDYTGNGVLITYPFTAEIYVKTDLKVYVSGVLKTVDVDYTIAAASIEDPDGGNVVFTTAPALSAPIAIVLNLPMTQLVDYVEGDKFPAETHERALDRLVKLIQYIKGKFSHVAKLGDDSAIELVMPNPSASAYIGWNAGATNLENKAAPILTTSTQYEVDALVTYGAGVNFTKATIDAALTAIGIVNPTTLLLRPGNWTITADADYSTYTNVTFKIPNGAYFTITALKTLTLPSPSHIIASPSQQIFSGAGIVKFASTGMVYPDWWGGDPTGTASSTAAFQSAVNSSSVNKPYIGFNGFYKIASPVTMTGIVTITLEGPVKQISATTATHGLWVKDITGVVITSTATLKNITLKNIFIDGSNGVLTYAGSSGTITSIISNPNDAQVNIDGCVLGYISGVEAKILDFATIINSRVQNSFLTYASRGYCVYVDTASGLVPTTLSFDKCYFNYSRQILSIIQLRSGSFNNCVFESSVTVGHVQWSTVSFNDCYWENLGYDISGTGYITGISIKNGGINYGAGILDDEIDTALHVIGGIVEINNPMLAYLKAAALTGWFRGIGRGSTLTVGGAITIRGGLNFSTTGQQLFPTEANRYSFQYNLWSEYLGYSAGNQLDSILKINADFREIDNGRVVVPIYYDAVPTNMLLIANIKARKAEFSVPGNGRGSQMIVACGLYSGSWYYMFEVDSGYIISSARLYDENGTGTLFDWVEDDTFIGDIWPASFPALHVARWRCIEAGTFGKWIPEVISSNGPPIPLSHAVIVYEQYIGATLLEAEPANPSCTVVLRPCAVGMRFTFIRDTKDYYIDPDNSDNFRGQADGKYMLLGTDGASVTIECHAVGIWDIISSYGTITFE